MTQNNCLQLLVIYDSVLVTSDTIASWFKNFKNKSSIVSMIFFLQIEKNSSKRSISRKYMKISQNQIVIARIIYCDMLANICRIFL